MPFRRPRAKQHAPFLLAVVAVCQLLHPAFAQAPLPDSWVQMLRWRCVGPAVMGGRITDMAIYPQDHSIWYVATASGGLLKTVNNGITFEHQFDSQATVSLGAVAVARDNPDLVWVGTGENNPRNSVSWGDGVYKSTDGGKTWQNMGLRESFQIGRIIIHPENPEIVYVGALGRLWGTNEERGLFKTTDGGQSWQKILYIDDETGIIDLAMHPEKPDILLAAAYERQRDGYDTNDPAKKWGPGSGLYRTTDGGATWQEITEGLPDVHLGRVGLDWYRKDPNIVYIVLESELIAQQPDDAPYLGIQGEDADVGARVTKISDESPAAETGLKVGDIVIAVGDVIVHSYNDLLEETRKRLAGDQLKMEVSRERESVIFDVTLAPLPSEERDPRRPPFSSGLGGQRENVQEQQGPHGHRFGGVYMSEDAGVTWKRINSVNPRPMYFSQIRVDPSDNNYMWVLGIPLYRTKDGGKTFTDDGARDVHVDHHAMWIDPDDGRHIILGNDGGIYVTHDRGENWDHYNHVAIGQFYHVTVGPQRDYNIYGGLQDNGSWGGPGRARTGGGPMNTDWFLLGWGDGFICEVDRNDPDLVYFESQNGGMGRYNLRTGERGWIRPQSRRGTDYNFNWKTPYILSNHNSRIYYVAGNYVFQSFDRGEKLRTISPEITRTRRGSATALAESHQDPGTLYVGTDDGYVWVTSNGGEDWKLLTDFPREESPWKRLKRLTAAFWKDLRAPIDLEPPSEPKPAETRPAKPKQQDPVAPRPAEDAPPLWPGRLLDSLHFLDANDDGRIQREEAPRRFYEMFDRIDSDRDGVLTPEEIEAGKELRVEPPPMAEGVEPDLPAEEAPSAKAKAPAADPVSGSWSASAAAENLPAGAGDFTFELKLGRGGAVTGSLESSMGGGEISEGRFDAEARELRFVFAPVPDLDLAFTSKVGQDQMSGAGAMGGGAVTFTFEATRKAPPAAAAKSKKDRPEKRAETGPLATLLPGPRWISSIETSRHQARRVYLTADGHRSNDDEPYVFASEDGGDTWRSIRANLPAEAGSTRVIREDLQNPDLLYLGTEFGAWVSVDRGQSWTRFHSNLPTVAVHEFAQHPTAGEIVAGTHGRSLWIMDVTALRQITKKVLDADAHLFTPNGAIHWRPDLRRGAGGRREFEGQNPTDDVKLFYVLKRKPNNISLRVKDMRGDLVRELEAGDEPGLHVVPWNLRGQPNPTARNWRARRGELMPAGTYLVELVVDQQTFTEELTIETDPEHPDYRLWEAELKEVSREEYEEREYEHP